MSATFVLYMVANNVYSDLRVTHVAQRENGREEKKNVAQQEVTAKRRTGNCGVVRGSTRGKCRAGVDTASDAPRAECAGSAGHPTRAGSSRAQCSRNSTSKATGLCRLGLPRGKHRHVSAGTVDQGTRFTHGQWRLRANMSTLFLRAGALV